MNKKLTFLTATLLLLICFTPPVSVMGQTRDDITATWTAGSGGLGSSIGSGTITDDKSHSWSYTRTLISGSSYTGWTSNCIQLGKNGGVENLTLSTSAISGTIKSVSVECSSYQAKHNVSITVGETTYLASTATASWTTVSASTGTGTSSGEIVISFTDGSRALYIKSITVVYSSGPTQLDTPTNFAASAGNAQATFSWDAVSNASSYTISYTPDGGAEQTATGITGTSHTISGLTNGTEYTCKIKAVGDGTSYSDSDYSSTITVTPTSATFYDVEIDSPITGGSVVASAATATAGTTITLTATPTESYLFNNIATNWTVLDGNSDPVTVTPSEGNTATFTMPASDVLVSATFTAKPVYTVSCTTPSHGTLSTSPTSGYNGVEVTITATPNTGYVLSTLTATDTEGSITITDNKFNIRNSNVTVTATFVSIPQYELYSGAITEGDYVIYYSGKAMKNTVSSNRFSYTEVTPVSNVIQSPDASIVWHIAPNGDYWTVYNAAVEKYAAGNGTANQAALVASVGNDGDALWTVSGTSTYEFVNKKNSDSNKNANLRNNGNYGFACYSTSTGGALSLYKLASTVPAISASDVEITKDATSGEIAYSITNPDGSTLTAAEKTDYDWMSNVTVDTENSKVTFTTTANTGARREGYITLTYGELTKDVKVTQAAPTYTVSYNANGGTGTMTDSDSPYEVGTTVTLLTNTFTAPDDDHIWGSWIVKDGDDNDITVTSNTFTMPASNVTVTAQWRGFGSYTLVTSTAGIVPGKHYVFASSAENGSAKAMGVQRDNNRGVVDVTISSSSITEVSGLYEFVISGDATNKYTIYDATVPGYLYAASSSSNYLRTQTTNDDNGIWTISIDGDTHAATIVAQGSYTNKYMRFNSTLFSCYGSSSSVTALPYLYMKDDDTDYEFYSNTTSSAGIASGETYTVHSPATLTLNAANNGSLIIEDGGQLVTGISVNATVKKNITAYTSADDGWNLISSPVNVNLGAAGIGLTTETTYDLYYLDEGNSKWINYKSTTGNNFSIAPQKGYLYANAANTTLNFSGDLQPNIEAGCEISLAKAGEGWNLVGNPFPFNAYVNKSYYVINGRTVEVYAGSDPVPTCTGIIVKATENNEKVTFRRTSFAANATNNGNIQLTLAEQVVNRDGTSTGSVTLDNAIVSFNEGSQLGKFYFGTQNANIYIPQGTEEYAIAYSEGQGEMPVNFKAANNGTYTLTVNPEGVEMAYLHLIDNLTGADVDLLPLCKGGRGDSTNPSYTFEAKTTDYESRFRLVFSICGDANGDNDGDNAPFAFVSNGEIVVNGTGTLQVVDVLGRILHTQETSTANSQLSTSNFKPGVYVLRIISGNDVRTQKIVVR